MNTVLHEAFAAKYPQREMEACRFDGQSLEHRSASMLLQAQRLELSRLKQQIEDLKEELQHAVNECCNSYWLQGHGQRVQRLYGITNECNAPDVMDTIRLAHSALTGKSPKSEAIEQCEWAYRSALGLSLREAVL